MINRKILVYETLPTKGTNVEKCLRLCDSMVESGSDVIALTDLPVGSVRVSPWAVASKLIDKGIEVLVHFTRVTRNALRIEADLLGMYVLGIRNLLLISGDVPSKGDYPFATVVNDFSIYQVIELVKNLNKGTDLAGNKLKGSTDFFFGAVFNPNSEEDISRAMKKIDLGVNFLVSQPVFEERKLYEFTEKINSPVIASIAFFKSRRQMEYFGKVPGIKIPKDFYEDTEGKSDEYIRDYTLSKAMELVDKIKDRVWGVYVPGIVKDSKGVREIARALHS